MNDSLYAELDPSPLLEKVRVVEESHPTENEDLWAELNHHHHPNVAESWSEQLRRHLTGASSSLSVEFEDEWRVDEFLTSVYRYFHHNGLQTIVAVEVVRLLSLLFTVGLCTFLLGCVQWPQLAHCDATTCKKPLSAFVSCTADLGIAKTLLFVYAMLFLGYWLNGLIAFIHTVKQAIHMRVFYKHRLQISTEELQTIAWDHVVKRLLDLTHNPNASTKPNNTNHFSSFRLNFKPLQEPLTPHGIASRIMRKENYIIALLNSQLLDGKRPIHFTRNLQWSLNFCVLDHLFSSSPVRLNRAFLADANGLARRFAVVGLIQTAMLPFFLVFMSLHFFLRHFQEWKSTGIGYFGPREWSFGAIGRFREYNELPHVFETRITASYSIANQYLNLFPSGISAVLAKGVGFLSGSLIAVLISLSLIDEAILFHVHIFNHQLLWYLTILTGVFTLSRSFSNSKSAAPSTTHVQTHTHLSLFNQKEKQKNEAEQLLLELASSTHYFPNHWHNQGHTFRVRNELMALFPYKIWVFWEEIRSIVETPYHLLFTFPEKASHILSFLQETTENNFCKQSHFHFTDFTAETEGETKSFVHGKLEKSILSFKSQHPDWQAEKPAEEIVKKIHDFKNKSILSASLLHQINEEEKTEPSLSQQLMNQSAALSNTFLNNSSLFYNNSQYDNEFYWLEKYYQEQRQQ